MPAQSYKNHIRFYTPHHFILYPVLLILLGLSIFFIFNTDQALIWSFISILMVLLFWLAFMLRQHYALILQNRIVRLELRYRYFVLTGNRLELLEDQLKDEQLFALRFAPDAELVALTQRALDEKLSGKEIKKAIQNWKPDYNRV